MVYPSCSYHGFDGCCFIPSFPKGTPTSFFSLKFNSEFTPEKMDGWKTKPFRLSFLGWHVKLFLGGWVTIGLSFFSHLGICGNKGLRNPRFPTLAPRRSKCDRWLVPWRGDSKCQRWANRPAAVFFLFQTKIQLRVGWSLRWSLFLTAVFFLFQFFFLRFLWLVEKVEMIFSCHINILWKDPQEAL